MTSYNSVLLSMAHLCIPSPVPSCRKYDRLEK